MDSPSDLTWESLDGVPPAEGRVVDDGIGTFNDTTAPMHDVKPLSCFVRDAAGRVIGGAVGRRWGACTELQQLWVEEGQRHRGLGTGLMARFEALARARGCERIYLDTFSFQAPAFYQALGYGTLARIDGYTAGIVKYTLLKELAAQ